MNQKTTLLVLALTLTITAALAVAPILSEMAYAANGGHGGNANGGDAATIHNNGGHGGNNLGSQIQGNGNSV